jgi:hypothetical protein
VRFSADTFPSLAPSEKVITWAVSLLLRDRRLRT